MPEPEVAETAPSEPLPIGSNLSDLQAQLAALSQQNAALLEDIDKLKPVEIPKTAEEQAEEERLAAIADPLYARGPREPDRARDTDRAARVAARRAPDSEHGERYQVAHPRRKPAVLRARAVPVASARATAGGEGR